MARLTTSRRSLLSVALVATMALLPTTGLLAQGPGAGANRAGIPPIPVSGTTTVGATVNQLAGTLNIQRFARQNGSLVAIGNLVATVTNAAGQVSTLVTPVAIPVDTSATTATCEILHLVLGPLDLNLLGLAVHLDQVVLDITAVPGAGNLLGNLLCAIAGLLDGPSPLGGLVALLNNLLAALGGL
jgi:hypothetical protein